MRGGRPPAGLRTDDHDLRSTRQRRAAGARYAGRRCASCWPTPSHAQAATVSVSVVVDNGGSRPPSQTTASASRSSPSASRRAGCATWSTGPRRSTACSPSCPPRSARRSAGPYRSDAFHGPRRRHGVPWVTHARSGHSLAGAHSLAGCLTALGRWPARDGSAGWSCSCSWAGGEQRGELGAVGDTELAVDAGEVALDCLGADEQRVGDLTCGATGGSELGDAALRRRQCQATGWCPFATEPRQLAPAALGQARRSIRSKAVSVSRAKLRAAARSL